jgi:hypothetical protein
MSIGTNGQSHMVRIFISLLILVTLSAEDAKYKTFQEATAAVAGRVSESLVGFPNPEAQLDAYMATVMRLPASKTGAILAAAVSRGGVNGSNFKTGLKRFDAFVIRQAFKFAEADFETRRLAKNYPPDLVESLLTTYGDAIPAIEAAGAEALAIRLSATKSDLALFRTRDFNINALTGDKPVLGRISAGGLNFIKVTGGVGPLTMMVYETLKDKEKK